MSAERSPEQGALGRLILALREEPTPELDWQRIETRLLREPPPAGRPAASRLRARLRVSAGLLAAAAAVFVLARHRVAPVSKHETAVARVASGPLNGDRLALGTHITAGNHDVVIEHAGRARWTLEPHATAFVSDSGEFLTVQLESGALSATVVPNAKPETFAVEAGGTRVAVHGTAFRVERSGDRVLVQVSEGTVAVEPSKTHADPSFLLRRDSRGNFGLDGRSGSVEGNASAVVRDAGAESRREVARLGDALRPAHLEYQRPPAPSNSAPSNSASSSSASSSSASSDSASSDSASSNSASSNSASSNSAADAARVSPQVESSAPPEQPSISDIESGVSSAIGLLNDCFHDHTHSADNRVSASTGMTLSVAGDGSVRSVTFSPPLAPAVEDCAVLGLRTLTFAHSVDGVTFTRLLELTR